MTSDKSTEPICTDVVGTPDSMGGLVAPRYRVLVADDEESVALVLSETLSDLGLEVQTVRNGLDALRSADEKPPDLLICDVMMPLANGLEVLRKLRERAPTATTPVLLMSAAGRPPFNDERARFVAKPFNLQAVIDIVIATLSNRPLPAHRDGDAD